MSLDPHLLNLKTKCQKKNAHLGDYTNVNGIGNKCLVYTGTYTGTNMFQVDCVGSYSVYYTILESVPACN